MLETVEVFWLNYESLFLTLEWFFTIIFTLEYLLRIYSSSKKLSYIFSFYGIIDLVSIFPSYLTFVFPSAKAFVIVRSMRVLRLFRILKLTRFTTAGGQLQAALKSSKEKIIVFVMFITVIVTIMGSLMYYVESPESGFSSIPASIYWAVVTMTTVGYGDIAPVTSLGKFISAFLMLLGYGVIAVPTGIISSEMNKREVKPCELCPSPDEGVNFCAYCGREI